MYLTYVSTKSESCDHYLYRMVTKKKPTSDQIEWWLKKNANDKDESTLYENIENYESVKINNLEKELVELDKKDPFPEIETI